MALCPALMVGGFSDGLADRIKDPSSGGFELPIHDIDVAHYLNTSGEGGSWSAPKPVQPAGDTIGVAESAWPPDGSCFV
jgi:hypothetical protein